jgi:hypothetical protein
VTTTDKSVQALQDPGFTGLEAQVYVFLLRHAPATGYRISHAIGKPTANTYKALAELAPGDPDDRVYALRDSGQVIERARAMHARARQIVLGDIFPGTLDLVRDDLAPAPRAACAW